MGFSGAVRGRAGFFQVSCGRISSRVPTHAGVRVGLKVGFLVWGGVRMEAHRARGGR